MCIRDSYDTPPEPKSAETPGHRIQFSSACRSSTQPDATEWLPKWAGSVSNSGQVQVSVITLFAVQPALAVRVEEQLRVGVLAGRAVLPSSQLGHRSRPSVPRHEASYRPDCPAVSPRLTLLLDPADRVHRRGHAEALQYPHTAATSPNARCWLRCGAPEAVPASRPSTSSAVPRYCWSTIRGCPSTRADSTS